MRVQKLFDLAGRSALVTGGGRGIGRHIAVGLAEAGARVVLASRDLAVCQRSAEEINAAGGCAEALELDLSDPESIAAATAGAIERCERLDILFNNAAFAWAAPSLDYPQEGWERVFDVNVRGLWLLSQGVARHMRERGGGSIVHIGSLSAWRAASDEAEPVIAYNASKGAVDSLTKDMAVKWAPHGIRVNCIAPGAFDTSMMDHLRDPATLRRFVEPIPQKRVGQEDDVKGAAVFLASDAAQYITGHTLVVDGGWRCT